MFQRLFDRFISGLGLGTGMSFAFGVSSFVKDNFAEKTSQTNKCGCGSAMIIEPEDRNYGLTKLTHEI